MECLRITSDGVVEFYQDGRKILELSGLEARQFLLQYTKGQFLSQYQLVSLQDRYLKWLRLHLKRFSRLPKLEICILDTPILEH